MEAGEGTHQSYLDQGERGWGTCKPTAVSHRAASGEVNSQTLQFSVHVHKVGSCSLRAVLDKETQRWLLGVNAARADVQENDKGVPGNKGGALTVPVISPGLQNTDVCMWTHTHPSGWFGFPSSVLL